MKVAEQVINSEPLVNEKKIDILTGSTHYVIYARGDSMIFKKVEKVVGLQQPAGRDYVQSKEYSSKLLN